MELSEAVRAERVLSLSSLEDEADKAEAAPNAESLTRAPDASIKQEAEEMPPQLLNPADEDAAAEAIGPAVSRDHANPNTTKQENSFEEAAIRHTDIIEKMLESMETNEN